MILGQNLQKSEYASKCKHMTKNEKNIFIWAKMADFRPAVAGNVSGGRMDHYVLSYQKSWSGTSPPVILDLKFKKKTQISVSSVFWLKKIKALPFFQKITKKVW